MKNMEYDVTKVYQGAPLVKLGDLIEECDLRNSDNTYTLNDLKGISIEKKFIETKANMDGVSLTSYKIVKPKWISFVPVTSRNGNKISLAFNDTENTFIASSAYTVFAVKNKDILDASYLFLMLQRSEFDRIARFNSWGSARETYTFCDLSRYAIPLPAIEVQRKYVAAYRSLQQLAEQNEAIIAPLQEACNAFLAKIKKEYPFVPIGEYIEIDEEKNIYNNLKVDSIRGLATSKQLISTKANMAGVSLTSYKIMRPSTIAFVSDTSRRADKISLAYNQTNQSFLLSSISTIFKSSNLEKLDIAFLYLWFCRPEFDRFARYNSWGSARETFSWDDMQRVKIPLAPIEVQRSIVALYNCAEEARAIAEEAREQLKDLAPAMVQRAANTPIEI